MAHQEGYKALDRLIAGGIDIHIQTSLPSPGCGAGRRVGQFSPVWDWLAIRYGSHSVTYLLSA